MVAASGPTSAVPASVSRFIGRAAKGCVGELEKLYSSFAFTEDQLEAFMVNINSEFTAELVPAFKTFLEDESQRVVQPSGASGASTTGNSGTTAKKRKTSSLVSLGRGLGAALGLSGATEGKAATEEATAPEEKRPREGGENTAEVDAAVAVATAESAGPAAPVGVELCGDSALWSSGGQGRGGEAYQWMDEPLHERIEERDLRLMRLQSGLVDAMRRRHPDIEDMIVGTVGVISQSEEVLCGRIVCESLEGKLNESSILLEAPGADGAAIRIRLSTAGCQDLVAFAGQLVSVLGRSGVNSVFHARDVAPGLFLPEPRLLSPAAGGADSRGLHMLVLSGPFCLRNGLEYSPLERVFERASSSRPDVVLLLGPLLDSGNQQVASGTLASEEGAELDSFEDVYEHVVFPALHRSVAALRRASPHTQVLLVPSLEDVLCFHPLPQPPLDAMLRPALGEKAWDHLRGVRFLPNPAHLCISGLSISVTSCDALSPMVRSGLVVRPEAGRRLEVGLRALLQQRCLFPVLPRDPAQVVERRAAALDFPEDAASDLCIFPSQAGTPGVTHVNGTAFVNPGNVCRPAAMGSFSEIRLRTGAAGALQDVLEVTTHKVT